MFKYLQVNSLHCQFTVQVVVVVWTGCCCCLDRLLLLFGQVVVVCIFVDLLYGLGWVEMYPQ